MNNQLIEQILFIFAGITLATALGCFVNRWIYRDKLKKYKTMTKKTTATITNIDTQVYDYFDRDDNTGHTRIRKEYHCYAKYEFTIDNQVYYGFGQIYAYGRKKKTKIYYNPLNPSENIPLYQKNHATGKAIIKSMIMALLLIFGLPLFFLFIL